MRTRLILAFSLVVLVSIISVIVLARQGTAQGLRQYFLHGGLTSTELASSLESYYEEQGSWNGVSFVLDQAISGMEGMMGEGMGMGMEEGMSGAMNERLRVADAGGRIVADTDSSPSGEMLTAEEIAAAIPLSSKQGAQIGYLVVDGGMGYSPGDELPLLHRLSMAGIQAALIGGAIAMILAGFLAYQIGKPVHRLTEAAIRLSGGDLDQQVEVAGDPEMRSLGAAFNHMAGSLKQASASRRAMTADIAHELRTPLAVQRAQLEALQDGVYPLTLENLQPLVDQNRQLTRLVEDLRTLALADAGELVLEKAAVNLDEAVTQIVESIRSRADQLNIQLEVRRQDCPEETSLSADAGRLEQILLNLLSNALRHTPQGGKVRIDFGCSLTGAWVRISDTGPGIPSDILPHIFERFYRGGTSRSRNEGGTGLGLAIARQLAEAHGGTLTAENLPPGGASFLVSLPLN